MIYVILDNLPEESPRNKCPFPITGRGNGPGTERLFASLINFNQESNITAAKIESKINKNIL